MNENGPNFLSGSRAGHAHRRFPLGNGLKLLMHHGDAAMQCIERALDLHLFPLIINFALVHVINAEHAFHQCGFSGTVLAHQRMNRTRPQLQLSVIECFDAGEHFTTPRISKRYSDTWPTPFYVRSSKHSCFKKYSFTGLFIR